MFHLTTFQLFLCRVRWDDMSNPVCDDWHTKPFLFQITCDRSVILDSTMKSIIFGLTLISVVFISEPSNISASAPPLECQIQLSLTSPTNWVTYPVLGPGGDPEISIKISDSGPGPWATYVRFCAESWELRPSIDYSVSRLTFPYKSFTGTRLDLGVHNVSVQVRNRANVSSNIILVT
jgi:hypothetical protein